MPSELPSDLVAGRWPAYLGPRSNTISKNMDVPAKTGRDRTTIRSTTSVAGAQSPSPLSESLPLSWCSSPAFLLHCHPPAKTGIMAIRHPSSAPPAQRTRPIIGEEGWQPVVEGVTAVESRIANPGLVPTTKVDRLVVVRQRSRKKQSATTLKKINN